jgi:uncharacterized protein YndB with AHSA1/START domain
MTNETTLEVESDRTLVITRSFAAPRRIVFDAITKPEHVRHWYGCEAMQMTVCEIDLRVGGRWRYVLRMPDGSEHGFHGEYREIVVPERIVSTENYEPIGPGHEMTATMTLEEQGGRTTMRNRLVYQSQADRDGHLQSGMESGMRESHERLAATIASLL